MKYFNIPDWSLQCWHDNTVVIIIVAYVTLNNNRLCLFIALVSDFVPVRRCLQQFVSLLV